MASPVLCGRSRRGFGRRMLLRRLQRCVLRGSTVDLASRESFLLRFCLKTVKRFECFSRTSGRQILPSSDPPEKKSCALTVSVLVYFGKLVKIKVTQALLDDLFVTLIWLEALLNVWLNGPVQPRK